MAWNGSGNTNGAQPRPAQPKPTKKAPSALKGTVAGVVVVALGGLVAYFLLKGSKSPAKSPIRAGDRPTERTIAEVQPSGMKAKVDPAATAQTNAIPTEPEEKWDDSFANIPAKRYKFSVLTSVRTNDSGVIDERWRMPNGKYWRRQIDPPPLFKNASDNAIAMVLGDRSGAPIPPYPGLDDINLDQAFAESLLSPIEIKDTDSAGIAALKMAVKETRDEISRMIRAGDTRRVGEILQDHIDINNHNAEMQAQALRAYEQLRNESGEAAAKDYLDKVNESLDRMGIPKIMTEVRERKARNQ